MAIVRVHQRKVSPVDRIDAEILLIEDQRSLAEMTARMLFERWGCHVLIATSFKQVQAIIEQKRHQFFLAISDLNLPDAHDGEVVDVLLKAGLRVIAMTGMFDEAMQERILKKGVIDYVLKNSINAYEYIVELVGRLHRNERTKVLVVDDSETFCALMDKMLVLQGLQVMIAHNGVEALKLLGKEPDIKLVLLDYNMPAMDGFTFLSQVRRKFSEDRLAVIGMAESGNLTAQFLKLGANDFISKPFSYEELVCRVSQNLDMQENIEAVRYVAYHDYLTDLFNRRAFFEQGGRLLKEAQKANRQVATIVMDIDFFKKVNDTYGHEGGDAVLKHFSDLLSAHFKQNLAARIGGEEFAILFTDIDAVNQVCESFRLLISLAQIPVDEQLVSHTVSIGVACGMRNTLDELLMLADNNLYEAKGAGRNRVVITQVGTSGIPDTALAPV